MIQFGARLDTCRSCGERTVVGVFVVLTATPALHLCVCAPCLSRGAEAVDQATPLVMERSRARALSTEGTSACL